MHTISITASSLLLVAASGAGVVFDSSQIIGWLAVSVALIGVPHGALDHWTGKELLGSFWPKGWVFVFFSCYLAVSLAVVAAWWVSPVLTLITFFVVSAWHFGLEDESMHLSSPIARHLSAIAIGGLVIWIPMLAQPARIEALLALIIPGESGNAAATIVLLARCLAIALLPIAVATIVRDAFSRSGRSRAIRNVSFGVLFAVSDVLISFGVYFCGWHSIRGLQRLAREHGKSGAEMLLAILPLSAAAIALAIGGMVLWSTSKSLPDAVSQTLFIGLSAIAVPHLLLHGPLTELLGKLTSKHRSDAVVRGAVS